MSVSKRERSTVDATHYRWDDLPKEALKPDLHRRLISTERMMLAHVYLDEGAIVPTHAHENEQLTYIVEGTLRFWLGDDESDVVDVIHFDEEPDQKIYAGGLMRTITRAGIVYITVTPLHGLTELQLGFLAA